MATIRFVKGDTATVRFNYENFIPEEGDKVFLTVKKSCFDKNCALEKSYPGNGIEWDDETNTFIVTFLPQDTQDLQTHWEYGFDIQYVFNQTPCVIKTPLTDGIFILDDEYTTYNGE